MSVTYSTVDLAEDRAYLSHHFNCPTCCAAGRTQGRIARCPDGQALWDAYEAAVLARDQAEREAHVARLKSLNTPNRKGPHQ
ncbi:hypothetical protein [Alicycliphilus denitrificans]|uniref:hypothetical protein n=1 Tax=Alicycliphilus denitrificans TaxID=179636 RepID=UPI0011AFD22E|nr:hypothetical protein [Alicycliphilus denitrificans]